MLTKILGAKLGSSIAKKADGMNSSTGAMIGATVPFVISRMSLPAMIVMGAGGYVAKRMYDKRKASKSETETTVSETNPKQADIDPAQTRPNGAAPIAAQPLPAGIS